MKENRAEVLYIAGATLLLGLLGVYLAINQSDSFSTLISNPFFKRNSQFEVDTTLIPSAIPSLTGSPQTTPEVTNEQEASTSVIMKTNLGDLKIRLFEKAAPNTVANFIKLSNTDYYAMTTFHRFIPGVLLQGGSRNTINADPADDNSGGPGYTIKDEINWDSLGFSQEKKDELTSDGYSSQEGLESQKMKKYVLAMANDGPNTAGSQFFIVLSSDTDQIREMEGKYTVFGEIVEGKKIIDSISQMPINLDDLDSPRPSKKIEIQKIQLENN